jgi:hypothetical protein
MEMIGLDANESLQVHLRKKLPEDQDLRECS